MAGGIGAVPGTAAGAAIGALRGGVAGGFGRRRAGFRPGCPGRGPTRFESEQRIIAAILRLVLGDVCLAGQDAAGPDLLRLGGVVYVNPEGFRPENLIRFGHHPERIVVGIPAETVEAAQ